MQRGLAGAILARLEARGLKIVALKLQCIPRELAERHYDVHRDKPFFTGLVSYITSSPVIVGVLEGSGAVQVVRSTVGATHPAEAGPGTIRGDFALEVGRNLIHASDSTETAAREVALFFRDDEIQPWARDTDRWVFE